MLSEELDEADAAFETASAPVAVVGGHKYQLSVDAEIAQSTAALSLVSGATKLNLDNVGIAVQSSGGGNGGTGADGDGKGNGNRRSRSGSLSDQRLLSLLSGGSTSSPAVLKGKRLFVKVNCPAKIGRTCRIAAQGMLNRRKTGNRQTRGQGAQRQEQAGLPPHQAQSPPPSWPSASAY